jgi:hypothetical protein
MRRLALLLALTALPLAFAATASGDTVTRTFGALDETESFNVCSFPLTAHFVGGGWITEIDKSDGTIQLLFTPVGPQTATVTNPANGKTLTGMGQTAGEIIVISDSGFVDHLNGITFNFVLPGSGGVLQVIGEINFAQNTFNGHFTFDRTAFCNYLADP